MAGSVVQLRVWRISPRHLPNALLQMAFGRRPLKNVAGVTFAKLLGTGSGDTFHVTDADLGHWAMLTVFDSAAAARRFETSKHVQSWEDIAEESVRIDLRPQSSKGRWAGQAPFAVEHPPTRWDGPVAALTRARIKPAMWRKFWSQVPPVAADLRGREGLLLSLGIGEAPVGLQGTFSVWESHRALTAFAQRGSAHRAVIADTERLGWYSEELFARFAVTASQGSFNGVRIPSHPHEENPTHP